MQPPFDIPADLDTPLSAYLKLLPFQPRFLLESVIGGETQARYSFLGFGEGEELVLDAGGLRRGDTREAAPATRADLLAVLRDARDAAPELFPRVPNLPFHGGLVGATGYELVRRFERLPAEKTNAAHPELAFFAPRSVLVFDHLTRRIALLHAGSEDDRRALRDEVLQALRGPIPTTTGSGGRVAPPTLSLERDDFMGGVERAKESIFAGDVYQLVLSSRFTGETDVDPLTAYRALRLLNPSPYMYLLDFAGIAVVGASPEALVKLAGRSASLQPIAGTRPRGGDEAADVALEEELLADPKEAAEHVMLVDLARNDLGRVAVPGSIEVAPYRSIERFSHVMHLVSGVRGVLEVEQDAFDLFAASFPAGTVVGAPKVRAMEIIDELEPVGRGLYAGTVGYFDKGGSMDQAIAIRTMVFQNGAYSYQAGAGVVAHSRPEAEFDEIMAKSDALRSALALAEEGL